MSDIISFSGEVADDFKDILEIIANFRGRELDNGDKSKILEDALSIGLNSIGVIVDRTLNGESIRYEYLSPLSYEDFLYGISDYYPVILRASTPEEFLEQRYSECLRCLSLSANSSSESFSEEISLKNKSGNRKKKKVQEKKEKKDKKKDPDEGKKKKKRNRDAE